LSSNDKISTVWLDAMNEPLTQNIPLYYKALH
jgi:hypothetical protein